MHIDFYPVTKKRWHDLEILFESRGGPHFCWCTAWRKVHKAGKKATKNERKTTMQSCVDAGTPVGILAYDDGQPVAWCSIAPRNSYRALRGLETNKEVWSIACFFITRAYRNKGLQLQLIEQAVSYAAQNGAEYIEAYPVERDTTSYRFMGYKETFEKAGFRFLKRAGTRRQVMIKEI